MIRFHRMILATVIAGLVLTAGCGDSSASDTGNDAGVGDDANAGNDAGVGDDAGTDSDGGPEPDSAVIDAWQLEAGHFVAAKMSMQIIYPRPDTETNAYARHRKLYPSLAYRIPVVVQGGAWPFKYELTGNTTLPGAAIGGTLLVLGDHQEVGDDYGVISGTAPASASYTVEARVTDQDGTVVTVSWEVTVDADAFIFFDENAIGSTNLGTVDEPYTDWATAFGTSHATINNYDKAVYFRGGTHTLTGFSDSSDNFRIDGDHKPRVWLGYPGETVTISLNGQANFVLLHDDLFFGNLTFDGNPDKGANYTYQFRVFGPKSRGPTWFDCTFQNYSLHAATAGDNPSLFYFTGIQEQYVSVTHSRFTGTLGNCLTAYHITDAVWEHITIDNADFTGNTSGQNSHAAFYFKDGGNGTASDGVNDGYVSNFTFRNVNVWDTVNMTGIQEAIGVNAQGDTQWVEVCYCTLDSGIKSPSGPTFALDHVFLYRNSLTFDIHGLTPDSYSDLTAEYNLFATDAVVANSGYYSDENNISEATPLDATMKLTGTARASYLGTHGAEIDVP